MLHFMGFHMLNDYRRKRDEEREEKNSDSHLLGCLGKRGPRLVHFRDPRAKSRHRLDLKCWETGLKNLAKASSASTHRILTVSKRQHGSRAPAQTSLYRCTSLIECVLWPSPSGPQNLCRSCATSCIPRCGSTSRRRRSRRSGPWNFPWAGTFYSGDRIRATKSIKSH